MTEAELHALTVLVASLLERAEIAENKAKGWQLIAESLMGVPHKS